MSRGLAVNESFHLDNKMFAVFVLSASQVQMNKSAKGMKKTSLQQEVFQIDPQCGQLFY